MKLKPRTFFRLIKESYLSWNLNDPWARSATIAYYALFSLPSLIIIVVHTAGYFFGTEAVQGSITQEIGNFIGLEAANAVEDMVANAAINANSTLAIIFGGGALIFGATGLFFQLKAAMNNIWSVTAKKETIWRTVINRMISFGMVMVVGLLLLISLIISTLLKVVGEYLAEISQVFSMLMLNILNFAISFAIITSLFAAIFKWLPDVQVRWKITYLGAAMTTFLFLLGEFLISFYFGQTQPGSVYGGASAVILILLWVYYTCLIVFFGAEFTQQYALYKNEKIVPNQYAEPAIYQELERLEKKKSQFVDRDRIISIFQDKAQEIEHKKETGKQDEA